MRARHRHEPLADDDEIEAYVRRRLYARAAGVQRLARDASPTPVMPVERSDDVAVLRPFPAGGR